MSEYVINRHQFAALQRRLDRPAEAKPELVALFNRPLVADMAPKANGHPVRKHR